MWRKVSHVATRCAVLTPASRGAVATIAVEGHHAEEMVDHFFVSVRGKPAQNWIPGRLVFGRWGGQQGEELVACRRAVGRIELHCHGGVAASRALISSLASAGCEVIEWDHWLLKHHLDPFTAAALELLAKAPTERTTAVLLDQSRGALRSVWDQIERGLDSTQLAEQTAVRCLLGELLAMAPVGLHIATPWRVAIVGLPNVGKSSLLNALLGYARALVCDQPGTTRDIVTAETALEGWPIEFADTAGQRTSLDPLEAEGVVRARSQATEADLVLLVSDSSQPWSAEEERLLSVSPSVLVVHSKADLANSGAWRPTGLATSALTSAGIPELAAAIVNHLVPQAPVSGQAVPFTTGQIAQLLAWRNALAAY